MYVCICNNVTEKDIERAVLNGACSMLCLRDHLGLSSKCGQCHGAARECLDSFLQLGLDEELVSR
ncbi:MAG TPA: hypothetical protein DGR97_01560 [Gammaproteobacteria bacterium]|nr:hypothetical protein [Gammaproteobacteria bacterium]